MSYREAASARPLRTVLGALALCLSAGVAATPAHAQGITRFADLPQRMTVWDLEIGSTLEEMPDLVEFRRYACGSDGGPPRRPLTGWADYAQCPIDPKSGLHEVYFEYDNEVEFFLRAMDDGRVARFVGTTDKSFPIVASALFDDGGVLRGIRVVTDPRADYTKDAFFDLGTLRLREDHYLLGPFLGSQFLIAPEADCVNIPLGPDEAEVGNTHTKLDCEKVDAASGLRYVLQTRYLRKPGQLGRDPRTGALTQGQFESWTRAEIYEVGYGPAPLPLEGTRPAPAPVPGGTPVTPGSAAP
ncbi:MAG: hypothetical protein IT535_04470 [Bauldia sp.]|nr:hypothetical protein [Bauldia sp.]